MRSGSSIFMSLIALGVYHIGIIKQNNLLGNSAAVLFLCLMNPPLLLLLRYSRSMAFTHIVSFFVTVCEVIGYTAVIYFFGGVKSLWLCMMYAVLINYIGLAGPWWRPFVAASLCWMVLAGAVALEYAGVIPGQDPAALPVLSGIYQAAIVAGVAGLLYVVAFVSSYMGVLLRNRKRSLEEKSVALEQAEKKIRKSRDELEKRVEERTAQLALINENLTQEISERQKAENALKESEARYRTLFEDNPIEIIVVDKQARITEYNRFDNRSAKDGPALGKVMYKEYAAGYTIDMHQRLTECILQKKIRDFPEQFFNNQYLDIRMAPLEDGAIITMIDQTDKRRLKTQLVRAQKMEALGVMAGGIAHDLNNILSGIVTYPDLILEDLPQDSPLRKPIEIMQESGLSAARVVADLMTIAKGIASRKEPINLNTAVRDYVNSIEYASLGKKYPEIVVDTQLAPGLGNIIGSDIHLKKVLMNLVSNAAEAIVGKGRIVIATMGRHLDKPLSGYEDLNQGEYAELEVSDNGTGIPPENLDRIFEPFFTKKVMGRTGTGLGLSVVWNTVQDHDAYITVGSSEKGSRFRLFFPVTEEAVEIEGPSFLLDDYLGKGETILVVDDEERQREIACDLLTRLKYRVHAVSGGQEAIAHVKKQSVDLVVMDMVMPRGLSGCETYERILGIIPGQKAIIVSGFAMGQEVEKAIQLGAGRYIKKPYTLIKLAAAVKDELKGD
ncbi:MAG: response regulator [Proteobacteria bacterium]|nr:response regulator [Pseudomonadota bacterium]MBU4132459.1 response regulator [Pseudomonadota bacterium]